MARFMDLNNIEAGDPFGYVDTRIVDADGGDAIPRQARGRDRHSTDRRDLHHHQPPDQRDEHGPARPDDSCRQRLRRVFRVHGHGADEQSVILFSRSTNCGATWSTPKALSTGIPTGAERPDCGESGRWRGLRVLAAVQIPDPGRRRDGRQVDRRRASTSARCCACRGVRPFDQGTTPTSFRTNGFQTMAIDATGRVYLAWPDRGYAERAPGSGDRRLAHRHLHVDQRIDVDGSAGRAGSRCSAIS